MPATAFDPLAAARDLKEAGFEQRQAETLAAQLRSAADAGHDELATKADLKAEIGILRTDLKSEIESLRTDLYRQLWIQGGAIVAILTALRFLPTGS